MQLAALHLLLSYRGLSLRILSLTLTADMCSPLLANSPRSRKEWILKGPSSPSTAILRIFEDKASEERERGVRKMKRESPITSLFMHKVAQTGRDLGRDKGEMRCVLETVGRRRQ